MADNPVDTVDTPQTEAAPVEKAPKKKPAAKKTAAKKAPAKKASAPKDASKSAATDGATSEGGDGEKKPPAKKAAAKKTPAKKAAAKKTASAKSAKPAASDVADDAKSDGSDGDAAGPTAAVLFQAPEPVAKRTAAKKKASAPSTETADEAPKAEGSAEDQSESEAEDGDGGEGGDGGTSAGARRRRRRGGRRRRKPSGSGAAGGDDAEDGDGEPDDDTTSGQTGEIAESDEAADAAEPDAASDEQTEGGGSSSSSRRRRRRRREGEGSADSDEDPNTVTRVRKARSPEDEITAVSGSTRLEAKKQRRREGREAGRRRAPIVSEAEFLARRESVERVMVIRQRKDLTQIAVLEDNVLVEHYVARESQTSLIGNVYLGRVQNVLPSMEAAFVDIGKGRNAVLYAGEVNWAALGHKEGTPRKIESVLQSGQTVLVQVTKDPIGHKGARLTSQVSLAGRFLVYVPDGTTSGISRKLPDTERGRLKALLKEIVPDTAGVIVRTAAEGASEEELTRDVERLKARWEDIEAKSAKGNAPQLLYGEPDLTLKVVRDLFTEDFAKLVIQGEEAWETVHGYVEHVASDLGERLEHYVPSSGAGEDAARPDVFATYRIDEQIAKGLDRKVWLPSGGSLIIDRTEAMTVIDVNTGKFTGSGGNLEETVTKNNLEAAEEIVRQLRLRDIGGIIVVDFIDMVLESNRDLVLRRLVECLGRDRTRHQVAEVTSLGLVQMTRKRIGTGLLEAFSENCDHCQGRGIIVHELPVEARRGGGDDESRRSGRRRRGRGGSTSDQEPAAKAMPSPKDVAAMAKPPASDAHEAEDAEEAEVTEQTATDVEQVEASPEVVQPDEPTEPETTEPETTETEPETTETSAAAEPVEAPVEAGPPKVVTRTRRRAASRPAGPPETVSEPAVPEPSADAGGSLNDVGGRSIGDIGAPVDDGSVEPADVPHEPAVQPPAEEPHVEHVPIKRKGTRKR